MKRLFIMAVLSSSFIMTNAIADSRYILKDKDIDTTTKERIESKPSISDSVNTNNNTNNTININDGVSINFKNGRLITILNILRKEFGVEYYIEDPYSSIDYSSMYKNIDINNIQQIENTFSDLAASNKKEDRPQIDQELNRQSGQILLGATGNNNQGNQQQQSNQSQSSSFCGQPIIFEPITISTVIKKEKLKSFIDKLCELANVSCQYDEKDNTLTIRRYKEYAIDVNNLFNIILNEPVEVVASSGSSAGGSSAGGSSAGGSSAGGSTTGGSSSIRYSTRYNEFINQVVDYKSCEGKISLSGDTLYILDRPKYAQTMVNILKKELEKKPLDLKISIYRFVYNTNTQLGVDFSLTGLLKNFLSNNIRYGLNVNTAGLVTSPTGSFIVSGKDHQQRALFNFIERYGRLYLVNEWNASLKPNVPVLLRDTENIPYVVPQSTTGTSGTSVSYEPRFASVGLKLTLSLSNVKRDNEDNQKYQGNIIAELSELVSMVNFTVGTSSRGDPITTQVPNVKGTKVYIPFEITMDDMVILTGFRMSSKRYESQGVPYLARIPVLNKLFGETEDIIRRSEIIIVVSPVYDKVVMDNIIKEVERKTDIRKKD